MLTREFENCFHETISIQTQLVCLPGLSPGSLTPPTDQRLPLRPPPSPLLQPTFLVLSMALRMDMFRSSRAPRTFSYSPRCWEKYSEGEAAGRRSVSVSRGAEEPGRHLGLTRARASCGSGQERDATQQQVKRPTYRRARRCPRCCKNGREARRERRFSSSSATSNRWV